MSINFEKKNEKNYKINQSINNSLIGKRLLSLYDLTSSGKRQQVNSHSNNNTI